jgi:hypothetical protein
LNQYTSEHKVIARAPSYLTALFPWAYQPNQPVIQQCFSLTTNQRTVAKRTGRTRLIIRLSHQKLSTESGDGNESKPRGKLGSIARIVLEGKKETTTVVLKQGLSVGFPYHYPQ